jgi:hypothetical protein
MVILPPFERSIMSCVRWILLCLGKAKKKCMAMKLTCLGAQECRQAFRNSMLTDLFGCTGVQARLGNSMLVDGAAKASPLARGDAS